MKVKRSNSAVNVLIGICAAIALGFILLMVASNLLITERIGEGNIGLLATIILLISSFIGNWMGEIMHGGEAPKTQLLITSCLLFVVVIGSLVMEGAYEDTFSRILAILGGGAISCVICMKNRGKSRKRKSHYC